MEKIIDKIVSTISEPFMLLALLVIIGLFHLLLQRDKSDKEFSQAMKEISTALGECNNSICGMIPLLEILVYGKGGKS